MPDPIIKAEVTLNDGVATASICGPDSRAYTETVPLHPLYPEGAPDEYLALDSLRSAIVQVEKERFDSLFDLKQTQEAAQRAKELGLHQEPARTFRPPSGSGGSDGNRYVVYGGARGTGRRMASQELVRAVRAHAFPNEPTTSYRREEPRESPVATAAQESPLSVDDIMQSVRAVLDGPSSIEPAPIVAGGRLTNGRHIITPGGTYQVVQLQSTFLVDPTRTPEGPSNEWIRAELARRIANELAGRIGVSRVVRATADRYFPDTHEYRAEITLLERRD